jgi:hypothetical protein
MARKHSARSHLGPPCADVSIDRGLSVIGIEVHEIEMAVGVVSGRNDGRTSVNTYARIESRNALALPVEFLLREALVILGTVASLAPHVHGHDLRHVTHKQLAQVLTIAYADFTDATRVQRVQQVGDFVAALNSADESRGHRSPMSR